MTREEAINTLRELCRETNESWYEETYNMAIEALSADAEQGEWIDYVGKDLGIEGQWLRDDGKTVFVQCDQCDSMFVRNLMTHMNYCPNCGADMRGEKHE
jgi:hypothetical protein